MGKLKKIGKGLTAISLSAGHALNKAAARRDMMEKQFNKFFGENGLRHKGVNGQKAKKKAALCKPTNFFTDDRSKDQGVKKDKFFGKSGKKKKDHDLY